jgi:hypothetical protein
VLGLKRRVLLSRAYRVPVVGRLVRIGTAVAGLPGLLRHLQRLEQAFAATATRTDGLLATSEAERRARADAEAEPARACRSWKGRSRACPTSRALVAEAASGRRSAAA